MNWSSQKILMRRATRPDKRADGKIEKYHSHHQINLEVPMFRSESPGIAQAPETLGKKQSKQREEKSCDLMPQCTASGGERLPESTAKPSTALRCLANQIAAGNRAARRHRPRLRFCPGWRGGRSPLGWGGGGRCISRGSHMLRLLPQSLRCQAGPDPKPST